jgi:hypothetical protein
VSVSAALTQVLLKALLQYPDMATAHFEPADLQLLALFAGSETDRASAYSMLYIQTFQQYWQQLLDNGCMQPDLAQKVRAAHDCLCSFIVIVLPGCNGVQAHCVMLCAGNHPAADLAAK